MGYVNSVGIRKHVHNIGMYFKVVINYSAMLEMQSLDSTLDHGDRDR